MDRLKATLTRKVGPFTVGAWLIIVIAGLGIGLLVRKRLGKSDGADTSGTAGVGPADRSDLPLGIRDGVVVTGYAPTTVTVPVNDVSEKPPTTGNEKPTTDTGTKNTGTANPPKAQLPAKPVTAPPPTQTAPKGQTYTVQKGDTLWKIAGRFGFPHWRPIYDANRQTIGPNPDLIKPGQKLVIPAK